MKAFWRQGLLIGIATVAVGCVGPEAHLSGDQRLLAAGYPREYIDGLNAGGESFCRELLADKVHSILLSREEARVCENLVTKVEPKPRPNRSHQQGWADGKALVSLAIDAARQAEAQRKLALQAEIGYMKSQRTMEFKNVNK